jgi:hypothetical protein
MSELTKALIQFHKDVDKIEKNARANYGKFADLANVLSTVTPALIKNGLVITQEFFTESLVTTLRHTSGETINSTCNLAIAQGRNVTQEWGKAVTYQRRYAIVSLLGLVADMDMDGAMLEDKPLELQQAKPAPKKTVIKKAATPAPTPAPSVDPTDQPLSSDDRQAVLAILKETFASDGGKEKIEGITTKFRDQFKNVADLPLSQAITTQAHVAFINEQL